MAGNTKIEWTDFTFKPVGGLPARIARLRPLLR